MAKRKNKHSTVALGEGDEGHTPKVQALSNRSMISKSVQHVLGFLNPILRGWWQNFRWDSLVVRRPSFATMSMNGWLCSIRINVSACVADGTAIISSGSID